MSLGQAKLQRGHARAGLELFERGLALATDNRDRYQEVRALQYIALAHLTLGNPPEAALEMARSATEWARKMPMLVGIIYGLAFQGLALSRLGRHDEAVGVRRRRGRSGSRARGPTAPSTSTAGAPRSSPPPAGSTPRAPRSTAPTPRSPPRPPSCAIPSSRRLYLASRQLPR